ncbi:hypothetical protein F5Y14DRAFT_421220 [Nemania sp. NC0429]|nr:hypothetical protein F5Y14DRAFT_421220 [Nemania sp. NC0429]
MPILVINLDVAVGNRVIMPFSMSIGCPVGYLEDRAGQGTMGLHLRLGDERRRRLGLTCRHVVNHDRPKQANFIQGLRRTSPVSYTRRRSDSLLGDILGTLEAGRDEVPKDVADWYG